jgi:hypothetical protein
LFGYVIVHDRQTLKGAIAIRSGTWPLLAC